MEKVLSFKYNGARFHHFRLKDPIEALKRLFQRAEVRAGVGVGVGVLRVPSNCTPARRRVECSNRLARQAGTVGGPWARRRVPAYYTTPAQQGALPAYACRRTAAAKPVLRSCARAASGAWAAWSIAS